MDWKGLREFSGLSQHRAARQAGLSRTRLSHVENGEEQLQENEEKTLLRVLRLAIAEREGKLTDTLAEIDSRSSGPA
jgi:transcriptional regulator with XRE-family HTH domain